MGALDMQPVGKIAAEGRRVARGPRRGGGPFEPSPNSLEGQRAIGEGHIQGGYDDLQRLLEAIQGYQAQASGQMRPVSDETLQGRLAASSDATAGAHASAQDRYRQAAAARGMESGGGLVSQLASLDRQAGGANRAAGTAIRTAANSENFASQERGLQGLQSAIGQLMGGRLGLLSQELPWRSRYEVTGEDPLQDLLASLAGGGGRMGGVDAGAGAAPGDGLLGYSGGALPDSPAQGPEDSWQRPGTSPGWRPAGGTPAGQAYNAGSYAPENFLGGGAGTGFGGVPTQYGGVPVGGLWALPSGSGNPAYAGAGGNFNGMTGTPEDILSQQRRAGPAIGPYSGGAPRGGTPQGFVRPGPTVSDSPVYGPGVPQTWGGSSGTGVTLSPAIQSPTLQSRSYAGVLAANRALNARYGTKR